jgi:DNA-binding NarL/FixJ family response regulator
MAEERMRELAIELLHAEDSAEGGSDWNDLFAGEWKLLDQFDRDGRRYLIARKRRRPFEVAPSQSEWDALVLRAKGAPLKVIAGELGVSMPTASRRIKSGMRKLGVRTASDLPRLLGVSVPQG